MLAETGTRKNYTFTNTWFQQTADLEIWVHLFHTIMPRRLLEVGCYEGQATTWMIEQCGKFGHSVSMTCVDTWEGSKEIPADAMRGVEERFDANTALAIGHSQVPVTFQKIKQRSSSALPRLLSEGQRFDLIYVDASHTAPDVLSDAVDGFRLLREGGAMIFDDYMWYQEQHGQEDALNMPKPAIDAFVNLNFRKLVLVHIADQLALIKTND